MKELEFDTAILGGGCIGSAIFQALTERGCKKVALIDHGRKLVSATAHSGGLRRVFHEHPEHTKLALGNHARVQRLQASGVLSAVNHVTGSLYFFNRRRMDSFQESLHEMNAAGFAYEIFTDHSGPRKFPQFRWQENEWAIYEPSGSQSSPVDFAQDLISSGITGGGQLIDDFEVCNLRHYRGGYRLSTKSSAVIAKTLVLAGGARLLPRFADLGLTLPLHAKELTTYRAGKIQGTPTLPHYFDRETLDFAAFTGEGTVTLANPDSMRVLQPMWQGIPKKQSAFDSYAPGRLGFLGEIAGSERLYVATGWGGTAFKFAVEIGNRVASLLERPQIQQGLCYGI